MASLLTRRKEFAYGLNCDSHPQTSYAVTLTPSLMVYGDRVYIEVIQVKRDHKGGAPTR